MHRPSLLSLLTAPGARAQPRHPIRILVGSAAGHIRRDRACWAGVAAAGNIRAD
ncbi:hypothetical protein GCM10011504_34640 [Siccirubricoccus deserti]|uniref:Uncharacterized protein n=1 Tax=Siccirubricoccus deserti TaxID=2013562 RepID=A0A9X0UEH4_9PROT|nr:hypothetical protein [Siccirubricoccus deserti]MBC4017859.1 hypothetical protein [Siccirubricoccus deserti]GGC53364.1 hypothetical protein GCM10011504_34640 [Siccirubricoccus deserti]